MSAQIIDAAISAIKLDLQRAAARTERRTAEVQCLSHAIRVNVPRLNRLAETIEDPKLRAQVADIEADLRAALAALEES